MNEFVPKIDDATIARLIQRDFVEEITDRVRALLESYGPKPHHFERNRVRAAVLKLANGDLAELPSQLAIADMDFRDVVGAAAYPSQMKIGFVGMWIAWGCGSLGDTAFCHRIENKANERNPEQQLLRHTTCLNQKCYVPISYYTADQ